MASLKHNTQNDTRLADAHEYMRERAKLDVDSSLSKGLIAKRLCRDAFDGAVTVEDVESLYDTYMESRRNKYKRNESVATPDATDTEKGRKANISKNVQFVKLGLLPGIDAVELLDKVTDLRLTMVGTDPIEAPFDAMLKVARCQLKSPDDTLDDETITACILKAPAKDKSIIDKLVEDYKRMSKRYDEFPCDTLENVVHAIGDAIQEAGGELPPMTKEDKAKAAFVKKANAMGYALA